MCVVALTSIYTPGQTSDEFWDVEAGDKFGVANHVCVDPIDLEIKGFSTYRYIGRLCYTLIYNGVESHSNPKYNVELKKYRLHSLS